MKRSFCFLLASAILPPFAASAQPQKSAPLGKGEVSIINAPNGTASYEGTRGLAHVTKDVVITQQGENLIVYAQDLLYSRSKNQATATGQLRVLTRDSTIIGQKLFADFKNRQFTISGDVVITSRGQNDGAMSGMRSQIQKEPVRVLCDRVVWEYDTRQATATGNVSIAQGNNHGICNSLFYDEPGNIIQLEGNVRFGGEKYRDMTSQTVIFYADKDLAFSKGRTKFYFLPLDAKENPRPDKQSRVFDPAPTLSPDLVSGVIPPPVITPVPIATSVEELVSPSANAENEPKR